MTPSATGSLLVGIAYKTTCCAGIFCELPSLSVYEFRFDSVKLWSVLKFVTLRDKDEILFTEADKLEAVWLSALLTLIW